MRRAIVSGQFYPAGQLELKRLVESYFSSLEVASLKDRDIKMAIVPHAGYIYSGKCASFVYKLIRSQQFSSFIILGTNHSGLGSKFSLSIDDFETPLGRIEVDLALLEDLMTRARGENVDIEVDENSHKYEHSIEVQLPFLQMVQKNFKILPILVRDLSFSEIDKFAKILVELMKNRKVFVLVSSDFTHYGSAYNFTPFYDKIHDNLYALDESIISKIVAKDVPGFLQLSMNSTVCGQYAIACCLQAAKILKLKAEKLCYYTSGDVTGDYSSAVGYASISFS